MCLLVMQTLIRGRCAVPWIFCRRRRCRRCRASTLFLGIMSHTQLTRRGDGLARLAAHLFAHVANAFALIGLGRIETANSRRYFADHLFVRAFNRDLRLLVRGVRSEEHTSEL